MLQVLQDIHISKKVENVNIFEVIRLGCFRRPLSNALQCQEMKEQFMDGFAEYVQPLITRIWEDAENCD